MSTRPPYPYDEDADDSYPPRDSYPPQEPIDLDDPRFGGGVPTPPRETYPPQPNYPPQNQPAVPPNAPSGGYAPPPPTGSYPPAPSYPPQGGQIDLSDPRFGGQQPPPPPTQGTGYPPPPAPSYPPAQAGQYPPSGNIDLGAPPRPSPQRPPSYEPSEYDRRIDLGDVDVPRRGGNNRPRPEHTDDDDSVVERIARGTSLLTERQVESIAWGSTIMLLGIVLILTVTGSTVFLTRLFPMLSGFILLSSSIYQRLVRGWRVSPLTWMISLMLVSYTITLFVDIDTGGSNIGLFDWITYFIGTLIILTGVTMLLRAFRR